MILTRNTTRLLAVVVALSVATPMIAASSSASNVERGLQLAQKLCSNCHDVDGKRQPVQSAATASPFATAANRQGQTAQRLEGYMLEPPHPAMPQVQLTVDEIRDVAAYILTLKKN